MNSDFSDFIRFFPIFRLFPTFRLLDSTTLEKTFLSTVSKYLKNKSYSCAVSRNLFDEFFDPAKNEIEAVSHSSIQLENFHDFMEPWTNRSGFPVVYLARNENTVRF